MYHAMHMYGPTVKYIALYESIIILKRLVIWEREGTDLQLIPHLSALSHYYRSLLQERWKRLPTGAVLGSAPTRGLL